MSNMHKNGFVTYDEMKLIREGLKLLESQYLSAKNNADNPDALRSFADREASAIRELYRSLENTRPIRR